MISNDIERLALMQALYKVLADEVSTNKAGNTRDRVNEHYRELYEETGATGFEVRMNGQKVGTYGFSKTKAQPARTKSTAVVVGRGALQADDDDDFTDFISRWVDDHIAEIGRAYFEQTGELPQGMELVTEEVPATPAGIRPNGTLRIDPEKVAQAMGPRLGSAVAGLLGGE